MRAGGCASPVRSANHASPSPQVPVTPSSVPAATATWMSSHPHPQPAQVEARSAMRLELRGEGARVHGEHTPVRGRRTGPAAHVCGARLARRKAACDWPSPRRVEAAWSRETPAIANRKRGGHMARTLSVGESLVGEGNEVAHIDLIIGSKSGPLGEAFASALLNQKEGHTNLLAVVAPNLPAKPDTIIANKVTIKGEKQAGQMFGPAQAAVARAVVDSVREGVIPEDEVDDLCIVAGVFIHWDADDDKKIFDYNYQAVKESIARALAGEPSVSTILEAETAARHPFAAGAEA